MSSRFSLGIPVIDEQHKVLFDHLDNLMLSLNTSAGHALSQRILGELDEYTRSHFFFEEGLMREMGFPDVEAHLDEHRSFVARIAHLREMTDQDEVSRGLTGFLIKWLREHINHSDRRYVEFSQRT